MWSIWLPKSCDSFMWWTNLSYYSMIIFHHCYWMSDRPFFESDQLILDIDNWLKRFDIKERFMYDSDILLSMTFRRCQCQWQMLVCFSHKELRKTCTHHMEHLWLLCFFLSCWSFAVFVLIHIKYIEKSYQNSIQNHFFFFFSLQKLVIWFGIKWGWVNDSIFTSGKVQLRSKPHYTTI